MTSKTLSLQMTGNVDASTKTLTPPGGGLITLADGRVIRASEIILEQGVVHARIALKGDEISEIEWDERG